MFWLHSLAWMPPDSPSTNETRMFLLATLLFAVIPWFFRKASLFVGSGIAMAGVIGLHVTQYWKWYTWIARVQHPLAGPLPLSVALVLLTLGTGIFLMLRKQASRAG